MATIDRLLTEAHAHWDDPEVLGRIGRELEDRNRLDHARTLLRRALELSPGDIESWAYLSYAHFRGYGDREGLAVLREGVAATGADRLRAALLGFTDDEEEKTALRTALEKSSDPAVRAELASMRLWSGDAEAFEEVRGLAEGHPDDARVREVFCWVLLGAKNVVEGLDLREVGLPVVEERIRREPDRISGYRMKVQILIAEKDWEGVLKATEETLARFPDEETTMQLRGRAHRERGDLDRAVQCFNRAVGMKPSFAGARVELGKAYEARERFDLAEEIFREIPKANPGYPAGPMSLALFCARRGRWEEAERLFVETWPRLPDWLKQGMRNHPDAKGLLEREAVQKVVAG